MFLLPCFSPIYEMEKHQEKQEKKKQEGRISRKGDRDKGETKRKSKAEDRHVILGIMKERYTLKIEG